MATKTKKTQKVSKKQQQAKIEAARKQAEAAAAKKAKSERWKKIGIVAVCVVLILALGLPVMAITMCSTDNGSTTPAATATDPGL